MMDENEKNRMKQTLQKLGFTPNEANESIQQDIVERENLTYFEKISKIVERYLERKQHELKLDIPTIEGESKKIYRWKGMALVELKPTMYSFTFNRYGVVNGTDVLRLDFWKLFGTKLNNISSESALGRYNGKFSAEIKKLIGEGTLDKDYPFISNFLGSILVENKRYTIIKFEEDIPPLEVVWKNYLVGTMKHCLKKVDQRKTLSGTVMEYETRLPADIIRFDWRNPLPDKDECIPEDFAGFYINTTSARKIARLASHMLNHLLSEKGYELIDLCYFMNYNGNMLCSEITPDGMRIRKKGKSFDKDLWRSGKDEHTIRTTWTELYGDMNA